MRVALAVLGRFHAFDFGCELARRGALERVFTSYPRGRATAFGLPAASVTALPHLELLNRAAQRLPRALARRVDPRPWPAAAWDRAIAARLAREAPGAQVVHAWSGSSLATLERARELGALTVVERASTHIVHQDRVLREEYERCGHRGRLPHPRTIERELCEYAAADRIAVPSAFVRRTFLEAGVPSEKILHLPYGAALETFRPPEAERPGPPRSGPFRIVHCGNVSLRKGCHYLLQAFRELALADAELWLVGPVAPEMRPFLERFRGPGVRVIGRVPQAEVARRFQRASVLCLASLEEGLAFVIPQAMATGLPVVATDASGAEDVIDDGREGFVVAPRDVDALKERLLALYRDRELCRAMGRAAAERVRGRFTWSHYAERALAAYRTALDSKESGRPGVADAA